MKKLFLLSILVCCQWAAQAQVFAPEGSKWWYCVREDLWPAPGYMNIHSEIITYWGDTLINNISYKKIGNQLTREAGDTVFLFNGGQDYILMNFSLEVGDTIQHLRDKTILYNWIPGGSYMTFQISEKGKIAVQNDSLRYYSMIGIHTDFPGWINYTSPLPLIFLVIEKMGVANRDQRGQLLVIDCPTCSPSNEFLLKYEYLNNPDYYFPEPFITSCGWLDVEEPSIQTSVQVYPNPVSDVLQISNTHLSVSLNGHLTDLQGRIIMNRIFIGPSNTLSISLEKLMPGVFILHFTNSEGLFISKKIVKQ
ncbi:MAG: T9SS type A sorting domain-containing protein [Flavobacteriales bacterium]|nr:T9SS type A sorting domain-containing protein [Flavobacteriales bacterium]